ncbi:hypothetical protein QUF72_13755 [Desulfobacterales bacterium HSG2]|nr:hypothetical protein [Desulfobacterales bacterium HSG2]
MKNRFPIIKKDEEGYMLIVTLLFLFLLTITGISATSSSDVELQTALNNSLYKRNFYRAESANVEAIRKLDKMIQEGGQFGTDPDEPWQTSVSESDIDDTLEGMRDYTNWNGGNSQSSVIDGASFAAVGIRQLSSLSATDPVKISEYYVLGCYDHDVFGQVIVETGWRRMATIE